MCMSAPSIWTSTHPHHPHHPHLLIGGWFALSTGADSVIYDSQEGQAAADDGDEEREEKTASLFLSGSRVKK